MANRRSRQGHHLVHACVYATSPQKLPKQLFDTKKVPKVADAREAKKTGYEDHVMSPSHAGTIAVGWIIGKGARCARPPLPPPLPLPSSDPTGVR